MLKDLKVNDFITELASNSPAPGGGSVAALAASLASALGCMVFNLTVGKKVYNEYDDDKKKSITDSLEIVNCSKEEFLNFMEKDMEEFLKLMEAFKLPKNSEEEKLQRQLMIIEGYKRALGVPLEVARKAYKIYDYINIACTYGNKNAVSDAGVAALLIQTAIESAVLNVKINLSGIDDIEYKQMILNECDSLINNGLSAKNKIMDTVISKL